MGDKGSSAESMPAYSRHPLMQLQGRHATLVATSAQDWLARIRTHVSAAAAGPRPHDELETPHSDTHQYVW